MNIYYLKRFERGDYIPQESIKKITNYICGQLISWSRNRSYYETTKLYIVCDWKKKQGFASFSKKGEAICNDQLVDFFKDAKRKNCSCLVV